MDDYDCVWRGGVLIELGVSEITEKTPLPHEV